MKTRTGFKEGASCVGVVVFVAVVVVVISPSVFVVVEFATSVFEVLDQILSVRQSSLCVLLSWFTKLAYIRAYCAVALG